MPSFAKSAVLKSWVLRWHWSWAVVGYLSETERAARENLKLVRALDDTRSHCYTLRDLGWIFGHQQRYEEAEKSFSASLEIAQNLRQDYPIMLGSILGFWGAVLTRQGKFDRAIECLSQSLREKVRLQDTLGISEPLLWLGRLHEIQRELKEAQDYYEQCAVKWKWYGLYHPHSEALTGLARVRHAQGQYDAIPSPLDEANTLAQRYEYNDHFASLRLTQGHVAWEGHVPAWDSGFDTALHYYQQALIYALRQNRFLLDEVLWGGGIVTPLHPIIPHCLERGEEGQQMLMALQVWWKVGLNDVGAPRPDTISPIPEGLSLLEAERIARQREPGDGSPQVEVLEKIEQSFPG